MQKEILYTPEELSNMLKLSRYTIYEMIKHGDIQAHHIGRSIRISQSQLDLFLMSTKQTENTYDAEIIAVDGEKYALVNGVRIAVLTELEGRVKVMVRPEDIILSAGNFVSSARNMLKGNITDIVVDNHSARVYLNVGIPICSLITKRSLNEMGLKKGDTLFAVFKTMSVEIKK
ncbi:MAG: helix-turn-helix domain-containing protein [Oscillospiraceae bacterium]|nr:helix-turn-helix domain-containing protein [Oscillospiraceae bacterium]